MKPGPKAGYAKTPETQVKNAVMELLEKHPRVAWIERMNVGTSFKKGFFVRFGFKGCADAIGQMKDGRFLAVEFKAGKEQPTPEQHRFLVKVRENGGVAFVARSVDDAMFELSGPPCGDA
jgi:hypothetical protein